MGTNILTACLGHEAMHAAFGISRVGITLPSYAEEAFCYSFQYYLDTTLTGSCTNDSAVACQYFNPWLPMSALNNLLTGGIVDNLRQSGYGFGYTSWPTGLAISPVESLIQTARLFWPSPKPKMQPVPWVR
jgi:hypothetical protein